jgi:tetratricopeptide (TPR) repeat protein
MKDSAANAALAAARDNAHGRRPDAPGAAVDRAEGLSESGRRLLAQVTRNIQTHRLDDAAQLLESVAALAPAHPEVLRLRALIEHRNGRFREAVALLQRAIEQRPNDALAWNNLGSALAELGELDQGIAAFARCAELSPQRAAPWFNLGRALDMRGRVDEAHAAMTKALERDPGHVSARVGLARVLQFMGRIDEAEAEYRRVLSAHPESAVAWYGLSTLRTARLTADDVAAIQRVYSRTDLTPDERISIGFALSKALEDQHRYSEAFAVLTAANSAKRSQVRWDARTFSQYLESVADAFANAPETAAPADLGHDVVFVFGLPRSGSTLVEQILAAHPQVTGANELEDLRYVIEDESRRRRMSFPEWVRSTRPDDWKRLGEDYLARTAPLRRDRPILVDKGLSNWRFVGALRAMLPGARLINCRRDPVENCLACFRQLFAAEMSFTYDLAELASFWRDYDRLLRTWHERYPGVLRDAVHERLTADPETEIRALLEFCGLPFDAACLRFHEVKRNVRTASAAQVREPIRSDTSRAGLYGALLDPLRVMLASGAAQ